MLKVDLRTVTLDVPPQEVITKDNVTIKVNAVVYFNVMNPVDAVIKIANHYVATSLYAQTTLRNILGQHELDEILAEREKIGQALQQIIDEATDAWGVKVSAVEIKDIELPEVMRRAMARQAEAERERRAKVIAAEGEFQSSQKLHEAAQVLEQTHRGAAAPLPADAGGDRRGEQHHGGVPAAHRHHYRVQARAGQGSRPPGVIGSRLGLPLRCPMRLPAAPYEYAHTVPLVAVTRAQ